MKTIRPTKALNVFKGEDHTFDILKCNAGEHQNKFNLIFEDARGETVLYSQLSLEEVYSHLWGITDEEKSDIRQFFLPTPEEEFLQRIEKATGKKLGNFGFICGTQHPFGYIKGMQSANNRDGFQVWFKNSENETATINLRSEGIEKNIENIINFIKRHDH